MSVRVCLLLVFGCLSTPGHAWADGPHIAFHGTAAAYTVTLFSAPDPLVAGPIRLTLLVQSAGTGMLMTPAKAAGRLQLSGQAPIAFAFQDSSASGVRLPVATVPLSKAGTYTLELDVSAESNPLASFSGVLPVAENHGQRNTVLWAVLLPAVAVVLFLLNQYGKAQLSRSRPT